MYEIMYHGSNDITPVSVVQRNIRIQHITSKEMVDSLRAAVEAIGEEIFEFKSSEIAIHSLHSGAAMAHVSGSKPDLCHHDDRPLVQ